VVIAGVVLGIWYLIALLPDLLYAAEHGSNAGAFVRESAGAELNSLRFLQLVLPAPHHPLPPFARLRHWFDTHYPPVAEHPALGLLATVGFLLLLVLGVRAVVRAARRSPRPAAGSRAETFTLLSVLTWVAFGLASFGGTWLSALFGITAIRGWNRMSIDIALLALAGLGLAVEAVHDRLRTAGSLDDGERDDGDEKDRQVAARHGLMTAVAAAVLVIGVADQSLTSAVPDPATAATFHSDQAFFGELQARVPTGAAVFQLPYRPYPESQPINGTSESDQLRPFLNTSTLYWSAGGIKGRPQTDWPAAVSAEPLEKLTRDLAIIGFRGILIDRDATPDLGRSLVARLAPFTGPAQAVSSDGRWAYLSLARPLQQIAAMTPAARADRAARLTDGATR
jgi:phosphoglycerol transferase